MRTAPTGPFHGIFEIDRAATVVIPARISGLFSPSTDKTVITTWTSFLSSFGKTGKHFLVASFLCWEAQGGLFYRDQQHLKHEGQKFAEQNVQCRR